MSLWPPVFSFLAPHAFLMTSSGCRFLFAVNPLWPVFFPSSFVYFFLVLFMSGRTLFVVHCLACLLELEKGLWLSVLYQYSYVSIRDIGSSQGCFFLLFFDANFCMCDRCHVCFQIPLLPLPFGAGLSRHQPAAFVSARSPSIP